jgi:uncharacterized surface protein with fasciclin (FAS1) repeats
MFRNTRSLTLAVAGALAMGSIGYAAWAANAERQASTPLAAEKTAAAKKDIVDTAVAAGSFKTLAAALQAADLVDTLKGAGPFTVFAPTDEAFAKLPKGTVDTLLKPENKEKLKGILTYHVAAAKAMSSDLSDGQEVKTVNGKSVKVSIDGKTVMIGDAKVISADVAATNGVIHVIDTVLIPE